jgi:Plavaka transposase
VSESAAPEFQVSGIYYRPLLEVIKSTFQRPDVQGHHWVPFKWIHHSSERQEHMYSDIYNSDAMLEEDAKIQALSRDPEDGSDTEVAIGVIMLWSDSTHLTNFGSASLWPIYLFFGNLSKYARGMPSALTAHHLAYIPSVSVHANTVSPF